MDQLTNWAGNITFSAARVHRPTSLDELCSVVAAAERVRALGTGHSFNRIADTDGDLVSVTALPSTMEIDAAGGTVRVAAGVRYGELVERLDAAGFALPNLGSLPHISVGGATATATHGSGVANGNLATAVSGLELVTASGDLVTVSRADDPDRFPGMVVHLGALGVVTHLTLDLVPAFQLRQYVYENLPWESLTDSLAAIMGGGYSVSLFTDWTSDVVNQVWVKRLDPASGDCHGATPADGARHPVPGMAVESCTEQSGVPGPWYARLPHFRLEFTPSAGEELQSEFFVPREAAVDALVAVNAIRDRVAPVLLISEIRTIAADDLWLSPHYQRDSVAIHFTWVKDTEAVMPVVAAVEAQLAPFNARPHWGKLFTAAGSYERMPDFVSLMTELDPAGKFRNALLDRYLLG